MTRIAPLLKRNARYAATSTPAALAPPSLHTVIVSCLDHRLPPELVLGMEVGDAAVIRNAGGRITTAVLEDLAYLAFLSEQLFGDAVAESLFEVAVIHHHQCGTGFLADPAFRALASTSTGVSPEDLLGSMVDDPEVTVRHDVARLVDSPLIPARVPVSGHVFDVTTGSLRTVCEVDIRPEPPAPALRADLGAGTATGDRTRSGSGVAD